MKWLKNIWKSNKKTELDWRQSDKERFAKSIKRKSSSAQIGGFRPSHEFGKSRIAGDFIMHKDEKWPNINGEQLDPILQINVDELPFAPNQLKKYKLVTIFINLNSYEKTREFKNNFEIRTYTTLNELEKRKCPISNHLKTFEINWEEKIDTPSLEELVWLEGNPERRLPMSDVFYEMKLEEHWNSQTKVGGWPYSIQHELDMESENYILQIGSEEKAKLNWTDSGIVYIGINNGDWIIEHQFY